MTTIPMFYLYGEPHQTVQADFVHIEPLEDRSRPTDWTIRAHAHAELNHVFHVVTGGGALQLEGRPVSYTAPALLIIPAGTVHGFIWQRDSAGLVMTLATAHLRELIARDRDFDGLFAKPAVLPVPNDECAPLNATVATLVREYGWAKRAYRAAIEASLLDLFVRAARCLDPQSDPAHALVGPQQALVARFRQRVEEHFRLREPIGAYAQALAVSSYQLRTACAQVASMSPAAIIDQRTVLEAKRALLYSHLPIGEIAYSLGFEDPAYFSRFFHRHAGISPRDFRR